MLVDILSKNKTFKSLCTPKLLKNWADPAYYLKEMSRPYKVEGKANHRLGEKRNEGCK